MPISAPTTVSHDWKKVSLHANRRDRRNGECQRSGELEPERCRRGKN
jgi:hypothetical protein